MVASLGMDIEYSNSGGLIISFNANTTIFISSSRPYLITQQHYFFLSLFGNANVSSEFQYPSLKQ